MNKLVDTGLESKKIFSDNLSRQLARAGKTQKEVAAAIGVTAATVCDWLALRTYPKMEKIQKLADYFGITKADLVQEGGVTKECLSEKEQKLLDLFHKVPEKHRDGLLELIEVYSKNLQ